ncbi:MAG TPA: hypothetical protein VNN09_02500 [Candidatus Competibacteraceae bacterium]|nr:hypothetical protein [Candidatus Competibacteraceae bacterium]
MVQTQRERPAAVVVGDLNIIRSLALGRVPVVLATSPANRTAFHSRHCAAAHLTPSPTQEPAAFVERLLEIGRTLADQRPVLFYNGDADLIAISNARERLAPYYRFLMPPRELIDQLTDKQSFAELARERGLPVPASIIYRAGGDPVEVLAGARYPCVVKPASRVGWFTSLLVEYYGKPQKALRVDDRAALERLLPLLDRSGGAFLVQQLIPGGEGQVLSYHSYVSRDGRLAGEYTGRKIRTYPLHYGISSCVEVTELPAVREAGRRILERLPCVGVAKMDFKRHPETGELFLLEINPRFNLWNYPAAVAGVNLPLLAYLDALGELPAGLAHIHRPVKWIDGPAELGALREARRQGLGLGAWLASVHGTCVYQTWAWDDPWPTLWHAGWRARRFLGRRWSRLWQGAVGLTVRR